jgi:hypothetical protein
MKCPVCKDVNLVMSERQGVEIDYCPECRGVWLDRGELDKVIERSRPQEQPAPAPHHAPPAGSGHQPGYGHGHKPYRKKSLLEELFD